MTKINEDYKGENHSAIVMTGEKYTILTRNSASQLDEDWKYYDTSSKGVLARYDGINEKGLDKIHVAVKFLNNGGKVNLETLLETTTIEPRKRGRVKSN